MMFALYENEDGSESCFTLSSASVTHPQLVNGLTKVWEVNAESYVDAQIKFHEFMEWEPYQVSGLEPTNEELQQFASS